MRHPLTARLRLSVAFASVLLSGALTISGCVDRLTQPRSDVPNISKSLDAVPTAMPADSIIATPAGFYHASCVHEIPDSSHVHGDTIMPPHAAAYVLPTCQYPHSRARATPHIPIGEPSDSGWVISAQDTLNSTTNSFRYISAYWVVPDAPAATYHGGVGDPVVYYTFNGLVNSKGILQPVLSYGYGNANYWQIADWFCDSSCPHSTLTTVSPGDTILGYVSSSNCTGGNCDFAVGVEDPTNSNSSFGYWTTSDDARLAVSGAIETYNLGSCSYYPLRPLTYSSLLLTDRSGSITPSWATTPGPNNTPSCEFAMANTSTTTTTRENALGGTLSGYTSVNTGISCHYDVTPYGGFGGYGSYSWSVDGTINSGQGTSAVDVTFNSDGSHLVSVEFQDSQSNTYTASEYVTSQSSMEFTCEHT